MKRILVILSVFLAAGLLAGETAERLPIVTIRLVAKNSDEETAKLEEFLKKGNSLSSYKDTPPNTEFRKDENHYLLIEKDGFQIFSVEKAIAEKDLIWIELTKTDKKRFSEFTKAIINHRVAVFILDEFYCSPCIKAQISGGKIQISSREKKADYKKLAEQLNNLSKNSVQESKR